MMLNAAPPRLSLLSTFRGAARLPHLQLMLRWLARLRTAEQCTDFELLLIEGDAQPTVAALAAHYSWVRYHHLPQPARFHKPPLLNCAARLARGQFLMPFDVDLLPGAEVLGRHLALALESPRCLVAGYRVQLPALWAVDAELPPGAALAAGLDVEDGRVLGPEDNPRALRKYLLRGERFGVCPCIPAAAYAAVGGMDEQFIGWGADDQDLIEKLCTQGLTLVRACDFIYFHLPHEHEKTWTDPELIAANRRLLAERRQARLAAQETELRS
jgi:hypothetical protein